MSVRKHISNAMNHVIVHGSLFLRREKIALLRRWKRAMLLPETILLAGMIITSAAMMDTTDFRLGQQAMASSPMAENPAGDIQASDDKRIQRTLQGRLHSRPDSLKNLTGSDVVTAFSYADLQRQEGDVTILQFRGNECVLDIYFNESGQSTAHYEFRPRQMAVMKGEYGDEKVRPRACINDILKSRRV